MQTALEYAILIIENYEMDIRAAIAKHPELAKEGFCQGRLYKEAVSDIRRRQEIEGFSGRPDSGGIGT